MLNTSGYVKRTKGRLQGKRSGKVCDKGPSAVCSGSLLWFQSLFPFYEKFLINLLITISYPTSELSPSIMLSFTIRLFFCPFDYTFSGKSSPYLPIFLLFLFFCIFILSAHFFIFSLHLKIWAPLWMKKSMLLLQRWSEGKLDIPRKGRVFTPMALISGNW